MKTYDQQIEEVIGFLNEKHMQAYDLVRIARSLTGSVGTEKGGKQE